MVPRRLQAARLALSAVALSTLIGLPFVAGGCVHTPLVAPSGTVITLFSTTNVLPVNGSTDIVALLIENGTTTSAPGTGGNANPVASGTPVHNGTVVSFTTTLGKVDPPEAKTTAGQVTVRLLSDGRSGVATITAYSGGASKTLTINIGSAAATKLSLTANPQTLPANGGTAAVTASVGDQQGNPIAGVMVTFSITAGTATLSQTSGVTDLNGMTTVTVTVPPAGSAGGISSAAVTVTGTAGGGTTGGGLTGTVQLTQASRGSVTITPPSTLTVGVPASFTVNVGTTVAATNVIVDFGDGDTPHDLGPISGSTSIFHTYDALRSYVVTVTGKFVDGTTVGPISTVVIPQDYAVTPSCPGNATFGQTSTYSLSVSPQGLAYRVFWDFSSDEGGTQEGNPTTHTWKSRGTKTVVWRVQPNAAPGKSAVCQLEVS